jgi:Predicted phosphohydrolases
MKYTRCFLFIAFLSSFFTSCTNLFSYSPFDADLKTQHLNAKSIATLQSASVAENDTVWFAVISDPHNNYDDLKDAITSINRMEGVRFVVCCGDITNWGTADEFRWYKEIIEKSVHPVITMIGNHDYLSNGHLVFQRMFGDTNFSFSYGGYNFVFFDDVVWEDNNSMPDFDWLQNSLSTAKTNVLFAHIPAWSDQMAGVFEQRMDSILSSNRVVGAIYGHDHGFQYVAGAETDQVCY